LLKVEDINQRDQNKHYKKLKNKRFIWENSNIIKLDLYKEIKM